MLETATAEQVAGLLAVNSKSDLASVEIRFEEPGRMFCVRTATGNTYFVEVIDPKERKVHLFTTKDRYLGEAFLPGILRDTPMIYTLNEKTGISHSVRQIEILS